MESFQKSSSGVGKEGNYIPKIQVSLVKEIYVSKTSYGCSEAVAQCDELQPEFFLCTQPLYRYQNQAVICIHLLKQVRSTKSGAAPIMQVSNIFQNPVLFTVIFFLPIYQIKVLISSKIRYLVWRQNPLLFITSLFSKKG